MDDRSITCQYIFTAAQHRRAMKCYWRHSKVKCILLAFLLFVLFSTVFGEVHPSDSQPSHPVTAYSVFLDFLPLILFFGLFLGMIFFSSELIFRRTAFFNKELTYSLSESGIDARNPLMNSHVDWAMYTRATESPTGFAVFVKGGRTFSWLPKDGFPDKESADRCRELLRQKIKKNTLLSA